MFYSLINDLRPQEKRFLIAERPGSKYNLFYQAHPDLAVEYFYKETPNGYILPTGLLEIIGRTKKEYPNQEFRDKIAKIVDAFKPFEPYDFQLTAIQDALFCKNLLIRAATGSGKSLIIGLLAKILTSMKLKGLILVPNISLVNQFDADLKDYKLDLNPHLIGGEFNIKHFEKPLTISTFQSLMRCKKLCQELDFIIIDECHKAKSKEIYDISVACENAQYKIGLTGTIPQDPYDFLRVCSVFGLPKNYITPRQLIDRGLGTNIKINIQKIIHQEKFVGNDFAKALEFLAKCEPRNQYIFNLLKSLKGNTVLLVSRNEHAHRLFHMLMPCKTDEKSYKDIVLQKEHKVYFVNGQIDGKQREKIRNILENVEDSILISNYQIMSTGINIKNLHNLVFGSPLKSYITITQSLGRLIRTHNSKKLVNVYDLADDFGFFKRQLKERIKNCYEPQEYEIITNEIRL